MSAARIAGLSLFVVTVCLAAASCSRDEATPEVAWLEPDSLHVWMLENRPMLLIDARPLAEYDKRHLPGSVAAGSRTIPELREVLPLDPGVPLVIYTERGVVPADSLDLAATAVQRYRFPKVFRLRGGLRAWEETGHPLDGHAVLRGPGE